MILMRKFHDSDEKIMKFTPSNCPRLREMSVLERCISLREMSVLERCQS